jgi:hypothetical protein
MIDTCKPADRPLSPQTSSSAQLGLLDWKGSERERKRDAEGDGDQ